MTTLLGLRPYNIKPHLSLSTLQISLHQRHPKIGMQHAYHYLDNLIYKPNSVIIPIYGNATELRDSLSHLFNLLPHPGMSSTVRQCPSTMPRQIDIIQHVGPEIWNYINGYFCRHMKRRD